MAIAMPAIRRPQTLSIAGGGPGLVVALLLFATAGTVAGQGPPAPEIAGLAPNSGPLAGGQAVEIRGDRFNPNAQVAFGGVPAASVTWADATRLVAVTPPGAAPGSILVTVTNPSGAAGSGSYRYWGPPPTLAGVAPTCSSEAGRPIVLSGRLPDGASITLDGTPLSGTPVSAPHLPGLRALHTHAPPHAPGTVSLTVTDPDGQAVSVPFTYHGAPPAQLTLSAGQSAFYRCLDPPAMLEGRVAVTDANATLLRIGHQLQFNGDADFYVYGPDCSDAEVEAFQALPHDPLEPYMPRGATACKEHYYAGSSREVLVPDPHGTFRWRWVRYSSGGDLPAARVLDLRVKVEGPADPTLRLLPPNLRPEPIFGPTLTRTTGVIDIVFTDASTVGGHPTCRADEYLMEPVPPERCLRFTFGWQNAGDGPLEVVFRQDPADPLLGIVGGNATQRIHRSDGTVLEQDAGRYEFHPQHTHYHHLDFVQVEMLRVEDGSTGPALMPLGQSQKLGVCGHDHRMADFDRFYHGQRGSADSSVDCVGTGFDTMQGRIGLTQGWIDYYAAWVYGNYVDFPEDSPDGRYVFRVTSDPLDHLLESNESDNVGYTLVCIVGTQVDVLERGWGTSPWDTQKVLLGHKPGEPPRPPLRGCPA